LFGTLVVLEDGRGLVLALGDDGGDIFVGGSDMGFCLGDGGGVSLGRARVMLSLVNGILAGAPVSAGDARGLALGLGDNDGGISAGGGDTGFCLGDGGGASAGGGGVMRLVVNGSGAFPGTPDKSDNTVA
jgi:hypothetical protein